MTGPDEPFYILLNPWSWLSIHEIPNLLGRTVKNFYSPTDQYTPDGSPGQYTNRKISIRGPVKDFKLHTQLHNAGGIQGQIDKIAQFQDSFERFARSELDGKNIWAVRLEQVGEAFKAITQNSTVITTLQQWLRPFVYKEAYFIVGLLIAEDAAVSTTLNSENSASGNVTAPLSTIAQLAAGSPITMPMGDLSAGGSTEHSFQQSLSGHVEGQRIIALDCRVVYRPKLRNQLHLKDRNPRAALPARKFASDDEDPELGGRLGIVDFGPDVFCRVELEGVEELAKR
jgi:hypothetical protein